MPFGFPGEKYESFEECVEKNQDRRTPRKYCGWLKKKTEEEE